MTWEEKIEMAGYLNNNDWENAFNIFVNKQPDYQAMYMFITGVDLSSKDVDELFIKHECFFTKDLIETAIQNVDYNAACRWAYVYSFLGYDDK